MKCPKCGSKMNKDTCTKCNYSERNIMHDVGEKKKKSSKNTGFCNKMIIFGVVLMLVGVFCALFGSQLHINTKEAVGLFKNQESSIKIEPTVLYDDNNILIKVNSISNSTDDIIIGYSIKNENDYSIKVSMKEPYINDIYVPFILNDELAGNDSHDGTYALAKSELRSNAITDIMSISFPIEITTLNGDIIDKSAYKKVKTNLYEDNLQSYNIGKIVYEDDMVQIQYLDLVSKPTVDSSKNKQLRLFVHNKTNGYIKMGLKNNELSINNKKLNIKFNNIIPANKYGVNEYNFNYDDMSKINNIKLNCDFYDLNTHNLIYSSDYFEVKIK